MDSGERQLIQRNTKRFHELQYYRAHTVAGMKLIRKPHAEASSRLDQVCWHTTVWNHQHTVATTRLGRLPAIIYIHQQTKRSHQQKNYHHRNRTIQS